MSTDTTHTENMLYLLDDINQQELNEMLYADGARTILVQNVDGQFYIPTDGQLVIRNEGDISMDEYQGSESEETAEIVYTTDGLVDGVLGFPDTQLICEEDDRNSPSTDNHYVKNEQSQPYRLALFKDGKLYIPARDGNLLSNIPIQQEQENDLGDFIADDNVEMEISKVTGRNLITGQALTLDEDCHMINKKLVLGRTTSGKKLVGRILKITKNCAEKVSKNNEDCQGERREMNDSNVERDIQEVTIDHTGKILAVRQERMIKDQVISRHNFEYISKTLAGLMEMDSVQRKLLHKNILLKLIEKVYDSTMDFYKKNVSYLFGYMKFALETTADNNGSWLFVLIDDENNKTNMESRQTEKSPYVETTSLTLIITVDKMGKRLTRINLNTGKTENKCKECGKTFKSVSHLKRHRSSVHLQETSVVCDVCDETLSDRGTLQKHYRSHHTSRWYACHLCNKQFNTHSSLKRHISVHDPSLRPLQCTLCLQRFSDQSTLKKHLLIHTGIKAFQCGLCSKSFTSLGDLNTHQRIHNPVKQYVCEVCGREFSRHSNLQRHAEIHKGSGALYRCEICGCSYNFISSLTRHLVQNHIDRS